MRAIIGESREYNSLFLMEIETEQKLATFCLCERRCRVLKYHHIQGLMGAFALCQNWKFKTLQQYLSFGVIWLFYTYNMAGGVRYFLAWYKEPICGSIFFS